MAELTLPQNSKVQKGKDYPLKRNARIKKASQYTAGALMMMKTQELITMR
jgi:hypothetical protein